MEPATPVIPGQEWDEVVFAKNQPEYRDLPAIKTADGSVVTRWRLTWWERLRLLWTGDLYLTQLTFHEQLQPILPAADPPVLNRVSVPPVTIQAQDFPSKAVPKG